MSTNTNTNYDEIDYSLKIKNFKTITETHDDETALKYLSENDWDESVYIHLNNLESFE